MDSYKAPPAPFCRIDLASSLSGITMTGQYGHIIYYIFIYKVKIIVLLKYQGDEPVL